MWQGLLAPSLERMILSELPDGFQLSGLILQAHDKLGYVVDYRIVVDASWVTKEVTVEIEGSRASPLVLNRTANGEWHRNGQRLAGLTGITDIDLAWSPATNTLPIRRLGLSPRTSATVVAAWVRFPSLAIERLEQSYQRLEDQHYRYRAGDFRAELEVDADGLVSSYAGNWRMVASSGWS